MLALLVKAQTLGWRIKDRMKDENGQTSSEYLVIAGVIVGLLLVILGAFSKEIKTAFTAFTGKVKGTL